MKYKKTTKTPAEQAEEDNLKAEVEKQKQTMEQQKVLIQYLAEMTDVYIPEEEEEENVQHIIEA